MTQATRCVGLLILLAGVDSARLTKPRAASDQHGYRQDCGKKMHSYALVQGAKVPGAGLHPETITPYSEVYMDGFMHVECIKDRFFEHGDKYGKNKFSYNVGESYNISIMRYTEMVPKEDREAMNHDVCFRFCRTVPDMKFFGLIHGRDCYCAPFYEMAASDSSDCDEVCEGNPTEMCGGKVKSSVFAMHLCDNTAENLETASGKGSFVSAHAGILSKSTHVVWEGMQKTAAGLQEIFGAAGDPVAGNLMQETKQWAGKVQHAVDALDASNTQLESALDKTSKFDDAKFQKSDDVTAAEALTTKINEDRKDAVKHVLDTKKVYHQATRGMGRSHAAMQYYPLMYFVDKRYEHVPSTCGGDHDKRTIYGVSIDECAAACDEEVVKPECVGFSYYEGKLCILFSKFKSVTYYTECGDGGVAKDALLAINRSSHHQPMMRDEPAAAKKVDTYLSFKEATLATNNLNGQGTGSGASELRVSNVGTSDGEALTLVVTSDSSYMPQTGKQSSLRDNLISLSVGCNVVSTLTFTFEDSSGKPITLESFDFSVFDFDTTNTAQPLEQVTAAGFDHFFTEDNEELQVTQNSDGSKTFTSTQYGQGCDNPSDPDSLQTISCNGADPVDQSLRSVGFRFLHKSSFEVQIGTPSSNKKCNPDKTGRFLLFGLKSAAVPDPPKPTPKPSKDRDPKPSKEEKDPEDEDDVTKCYAKLEDFVGTDLSPDLSSASSGKNKLSLKEATKAARCYK